MMCYHAPPLIQIKMCMCHCLEINGVCAECLHHNITSVTVTDVAQIMHSVHKQILDEHYGEYAKRVYSDSRDRREFLNNKFQLLVNHHLQQWHEHEHDPLIVGNATEHSIPTPRGRHLRMILMRRLRMI